MLWACEKVAVKSDEVDIIIENNFVHWSAVLEIVQFLADVENHCNGKNQYHRKEETPDEFEQYVSIQFIHTITAALILAVFGFSKMQSLLQ